MNQRLRLVYETETLEELLEKAVDRVFDTGDAICIAINVHDLVPRDVAACIDDVMYGYGSITGMKSEDYVAVDEVVACLPKTSAAEMDLAELAKIALTNYIKSKKYCILKYHNWHQHNT